MKGMALLQSKRQELMAIAKQHGVTNIRVFGSVARGEDTADSDIDLLVALEEKRDLFDFIGFKLDVTELLGKPVDVLSENGIHHLLRNQIMSEVLPL